MCYQCERGMKMSSLLAILCAIVGAVLYLLALLSRPDPPELAQTQFLDLFIGILLGIGSWGLLLVRGIAATRRPRHKTSLICGIIVSICTSGSLIAWHRLQLAERERNAESAAAETVSQTNTDAAHQKPSPPWPRHCPLARSNHIISEV